MNKADLLKSLSQLHSFIDGTLSLTRHEEVAKKFRIRGRHEAKLELSKLNGINRMLTKQENRANWKTRNKQLNSDVERFGKFPQAKAQSLQYVKIPENQTHLDFWKGLWQKEDHFDSNEMRNALDDSGVNKLQGTVHNKGLKGKELASAIRRLSPWKAPGPDGVHGYLVKSCKAY